MKLLLLKYTVLLSPDKELKVKEVYKDGEYQVKPEI